MTKGEKNNVPTILQVARFTTPIKVEEAKNTTRQDAHVKEEPVFLSSVQSKIMDALGKFSEPLTTAEIAACLNLKHSSNVRPAIQELMKLGLVFVREETIEERSARAGGKPVRRGMAAFLHSTISPVPSRITAELVPGVTFIDRIGIPWTKTKKKYKEKKQSSLPTTDASQGQMIDYLVQKIVDERTAEIQKELDATKAELNRLRDFLKSAI
jgi:DNA-binding MarR family transcriptional regulator